MSYWNSCKIILPSHPLLKAPAEHWGGHTLCLCPSNPFKIIPQQPHHMMHAGSAFPRDSISGMHARGNLNTLKRRFTTLFDVTRQERRQEKRRSQMLPSRWLGILGKSIKSLGVGWIIQLDVPEEFGFELRTFCHHWVIQSWSLYKLMSKTRPKSSS